MATAQAAVLVAPRQVEMQEFTLPEIRDDDGLLKIEITGVCGADWAPYLGDTKTCSPPVILGHEIVGRVERIGAKAAARWGVKEGDRVLHGGVHPLPRLRILPHRSLQRLWQAMVRPPVSQRGPRYMGRLQPVPLPRPQGSGLSHVRQSAGGDCPAFPLHG